MARNGTTGVIQQKMQHRQTLTRLDIRIYDRTTATKNPANIHKFRFKLVIIHWTFTKQKEKRYSTTGRYTVYAGSVGISAVNNNAANCQHQRAVQSLSNNETCISYEDIFTLLERATGLSKRFSHGLPWLPGLDPSVHNHLHKRSLFLSSRHSNDITRQRQHRLLTGDATRSFRDVPDLYEPRMWPSSGMLRCVFC
jgi:hypothetical protein